MSRKLAAITGVHGHVPDYVLTNAELETMVDTTDEWIQSRTGIKERRIQKGEGKATSDLGCEAVKGLLEKTNTAPEEVELVICATVTADFHFPDTANIICDKVGIRNGFAFDVNAACSGFLYALAVGARFIESGKHKKIIVVGADKMSAITDYTDRATCVLFGDGAGAIMLEPRDDGTGLVDEVLHSDGVGRHHLYMKGGGSFMPASEISIKNKHHFIFQEGPVVFKNAVRGMSGAVNELIEKNGLKKEDVSWVVPHQANIRIINSVADALDFPIEKVMINIQKYGNTTAATIPLCLWDYEKQLKKGDKVVLTAFGGGFTWGASYVNWSYDG